MIKLLLPLCVLGVCAAQTLDVYVIDVEGGNATLFVSPSHESLLIDTGNGDFVCIGRNVIFTFAPLDGAALTAEMAALDVGAFVDGQWRHGRRLNGDETAHGTGVLLGEALTVCRFRLFNCR